MMPKGVSVAFVSNPDNAALLATKILALSNPEIKEKVSAFRERLEKAVYKAAREVRGVKK
jgi:phosphoribosylcarboxyaminoimidazole (NCAIR) mutase